MDPIIEIEKLGLTFLDSGKRLEAGRLVIEEGDFVLLTGDNGGGKSTLFNLLALQGEPYYSLDADTRIFVRYHERLQGKNIVALGNNERELLRASVSFSRQEDYFPDGLSAYGQLLHDSEIFFDSYADDKKAAHALLEAAADSYIERFLTFADKKTLKKKKNTSLSGGQKKIIGVLSAFLRCEVCGNKIIFLDEPLNNLDFGNKRILNDILTAIRRDRPALTVVMISHCRVFPSVNKELVIRDGTATLLSAPVFYNCLGLEPSKP